MVKKKFGGEKADVKDLLAPKPAPAKPSGPAWAKGAGVAAAPPPKSAVAAVPGKAPPAGAPLVGSWAKGGPCGLAATATSLQAKPAYAPPARGTQSCGAAKASRPALGLKSKTGEPPPSFLDDSAFPEAERPQTAAEKNEEKIRAAAVARFPEVTTCEDALNALCTAAGDSSGNSDARLRAGLTWLLNSGHLEADKDARDRMLHAGELVIEGLGAEATRAAEIQNMLEAFFEDQQKKGKNTPQILAFNGLVDAKLFGSLAVQLGSEHAKFGSIRLRLTRRLTKATTPPEVQAALAEALVALFSPDASAAEEAYTSFVKELASAQEPLRRGGALGIAAVVKASGGAAAMKKFGVMDLVREAVTAEGKSNAGKRQGGLICLDAVASALGRGFDPYSLTCMPWLLTSCSDTARDVQIAGREAAKTVVSQVSSNALRLMVKPLLEGLQDKRWRTQLSAIELLQPIIGSMVADAPKRLATVLPKVVPLLCEAVFSTRNEVRDTARAVLEQIGAAISHQDIAKLAPSLISALADPADGPILKALDSLLGAVYTTTIDSASCSLICPIIGRALNRGDAEAKKKSADFVRTIVQLVGEQEELAPYLASFWPPLRPLLGDPSPAVRASTANAIAALSLAPVADSEVSPVEYLMEQLNSAKDDVLLEGSALSLAAIIASVTEESRAELLEPLLCAEPAAGRVGRLLVFSHLPKSIVGFPGGESTLISALPALTASLSEPVEELRGVGRNGLTAMIASASGKLLSAALAEHLEDLLSASDATVRTIGLELAFDLVPRLKGSVEARAGLVTTVVLLQADPVGEVRRNADRVWRAAGEAGDGAGKQLKQMRPHLITKLAAALSSGNDVFAITAGRAAVQLEKRLEASGGIVQDLMPYIVDGLQSPISRRSICLGLREILQAETCEKVQRHGSIGVALRKALFVEDADTQAAAANCFVAALVSVFTEPLLKEVREVGPNPSTIQMLGLEAIFAQDKAGDALKFLVAPPVNEGSIRCLAAAAKAPGVTLKRHIDEVIGACVRTAESGATQSASSTAKAVVSQLDSDGVSAAASAAVSMVEKGVGGLRAQGAACVLAAVLEVAASAPDDTASIIDALVPGLLLIDQTCASAFAAALVSLSRLAASTVVESLPRGLLAVLTESSGELAPDSFEAVIPLLQQGLGHTATRKDAAECFARVLPRAPEALLQVQAVKCAGPLVRALTDKSADSELQIHILTAMDVLLKRVGSSLRAFFPALQTSLPKVLDESDGELLMSVAQVLGALAAVMPKAEALVKILCKPPLSPQKWEALACVLEALSPPISPEIMAAAQTALKASGGASPAASRVAAIAA